MDQFNYNLDSNITDSVIISNHVGLYENISNHAN